MEQYYTCPYCWQTITTEVDPSVGQQTYVEDCEVCCQPIEIRYRWYENELILFEVRRENGGEWG